MATHYSEWSSPSQIAFASVGGSQYAYLTDYASSDVTICSIAGSGLFSSCTKITTVIEHPNGIAIFSASNGKQYAYIADAPGTVAQCELNLLDGTFSSCGLLIVNADNPPSLSGITFANVNATQYAYLSDFSSYQVSGGYSGGKIWVCSLQNNGSFDSCGYTPLQNPDWRVTGSAAVTYITH